LSVTFAAYRRRRGTFKVTYITFYLVYVTPGEVAYRHATWENTL